MERFLASGSLRIGTLRGYRQTNMHGQLIGDAQEGVMKVRGTASSVTSKMIDDHPILKGLISLGEGATIGSLQIENCQLDVGNLYIFSTSQNYDRTSHERWREDPHANYDACYKINSAKLFFKAISRAIETRAEFLGFGPVQYYDTDQGLDFRSPLTRLHPGQLKGGKTYGHQVEIRGFWRPKASGEIEPFIQCVPEAIKYCCKHALLETASGGSAGV